jgi:hypothetical protein
MVHILETTQIIFAQTGAERMNRTAQACADGVF